MGPPEIHTLRSALHFAQEKGVEGAMCGTIDAFFTAHQGCDPIINPGY